MYTEINKLDEQVKEMQSEKDDLLGDLNDSQKREDNFK